MAVLKESERRDSQVALRRTLRRGDATFDKESRGFYRLTRSIANGQTLIVLSLLKALPTNDDRQLIIN
ncbi:MAG: hypothetical protein IPJ30_17745 [Acidobacteria bacterium]|nr:hypothetical protein [Acidobacteriota bacterium]